MAHRFRWSYTAAFLLLLVPLTFAQEASGGAPGPAALSGGVIDSRTGGAIAGATVRLRKADHPSFDPDPDAAAYVVQCDASGHFEFSDIEPGSYIMAAAQPGFLQAYFGFGSPLMTSLAEVLRLHAGSERKGMQLVLPPMGIIAGRVLDEDGTPVHDVRVAALLRSFSGGRRVFLPMAFSESDQDGVYRLASLPPGDYVIRADAGAAPRVAGEQREGQRPAQLRTYATAYYPDAREATMGVPLSLQVGAALDGIDFRMRMRPLVKVKGKVEWAGVLPPPHPLRLALVTTAFDYAAAMRPNLAEVHPDGSFTFDEVVPGRYFLEPARVFVDSSRFRSVTGRTLVEVPDDGLDLNKVVFSAERAPTIGGVVHLVESKNKRAGRDAPSVWPRETGAGGVRAGVRATAPRAEKRQEVARAGAPPPPPSHRAANADETPANTFTGTGDGPATGGDEPNSETPTAAPASSASAAQSTPHAGVTVQLLDVDRVPVNAPHAVSDTAGKFALADIPSGHYRVVVSGSPEGFYLYAVTMNEVPLAGRRLDVYGGTSGELRLEFRDGAGHIQGVARDGGGKPLPAAFVSIWSVDGDGAWPVMVVATDRDGGFRAKGLGPGKYRVLAWEQIDPGLAESREFCDGFAADAAEGELRAGSVMTLNVEAVTRQRISQSLWRVSP